MVLGEVRPLRRRLAGAGDARLGIDDDVAGDETGGEQRPQRQQRRRRVAARTGHERGLTNLVAVVLGEAVDRAGRPPVRVRIPALAVVGVVQAEGAGEIEDANAGRRQRRTHFGRRRFGNGEECRVHPAGDGVDGKRLHFAVPDARQGRKRPRLVAGADGTVGSSHRGARVAGEPAKQFLTGIAGGADDSERRHRWHRDIYAARPIFIHDRDAAGQ